MNPVSWRMFSWFIFGPGVFRNCNIDCIFAFKNFFSDRAGVVFPQRGPRDRFWTPRVMTPRTPSSGPRNTASRCGQAPPRPCWGGGLASEVDLTHWELLPLQHTVIYGLHKKGRSVSTEAHSLPCVYGRGLAICRQPIHSR